MKTFFYSHGISNKISTANISEGGGGGQNLFVKKITRNGRTHGQTPSTRPHTGLQFPLKKKK